MRIAAIAVAAWVAAGIAAGAVVIVNVHRLSHLSDTVTLSAGALDQTAEGLGDLRRAPFVGNRIGRVADGIKATAASARQNAERSRQSILTLGYVLGGLVAAIPGLPALAIYLAYCVVRARDAEAVRQALAETDDRRLVEEYLGRRALARLPYRDLVAIAPEPWRDAADGHYERLAAAELARLGLDGAGRGTVATQ